MAEESRVVQLYGEIEDEMLNGVAAKIQDKMIDSRAPITIDIDSPDPDAALDFCKQIRDWRKAGWEIITQASGVCASAAVPIHVSGTTIVAMRPDPVKETPGTSVMIHGIGTEWENFDLERESIPFPDLEFNYNDTRRCCERTGIILNNNTLLYQIGLKAVEICKSDYETEHWFYWNGTGRHSIRYIIGRRGHLI